MAETEQRNWADLPSELLSMIFFKLGTVGIIQFAETVCRPWRQLALDPQFYRSIYITSKVEDAISMERLAMKAIARSAGFAEEFFTENCGSDELLTYIADRITGLKSITMIFPRYISSKTVKKFVGQCTLLQKCAILGSITKIEHKQKLRFMSRFIIPLGKTMQFFWVCKVYHYEDEGNPGWRELGIDLQALGVSSSLPELHETNKYPSSDWLTIERRCTCAILDKYYDRVEYPHVENLLQHYNFTFSVDTDIFQADHVKSFSRSYSCHEDANQCKDHDCRHSNSRILTIDTWMLDKL